MAKETITTETATESVVSLTESAAAQIKQMIANAPENAGKLDGILQRHELVAKWEQFGDKFKDNA